MLEFRYDTQLLIEGEGLDEDAINEYIRANFKGDSLLAVGDSTRLTALVNNMLRFVMSIYSDELNYLHEKKNSRRPF